MSHGFLRKKPHQHGMTYVEVLVAMVLVALMLVPAMEALMPGIQGAALHKQRAEQHYVLQGKLEMVLAETFDSLDAAATAAGAHTNPTSYSDLASAVPHNVYIWRYDVDDADGDNAVYTGGEDDLLWVNVSTPDFQKSLQTLVSRY
jgi:prepilin-type N-terminal cleavage/methylation domain-containing protein